MENWEDDSEYSLIKDVMECSRTLTLHNSFYFDSPYNYSCVCYYSKNKTQMSFKERHKSDVCCILLYLLNMTNKMLVVKCYITGQIQKEKVCVNDNKTMLSIQK